MISIGPLSVSPPFSQRTHSALSVWLITSRCNISLLAGRRLRTAICVYEIPEIHLTSGLLLKGQVGRWCSVLLLVFSFHAVFGSCSCSIAKKKTVRPLLQQPHFWKFLFYRYILDKSLRVRLKSPLTWKNSGTKKKRDNVQDIKRKLTKDCIMHCDR